ncbi:MAG: uroporphyrinogen decarboxylase [Gemmatimonadetes bacterium SCN 70-22]|nr:MAG: uroporphyrinogen decarboxylase [Gemmatimonadetes bacterium SCN 70-22]
MSSILLSALRGEATPRRPLWVMRQAGRYLPEYRALRAKHSFEELSGSAELAAEVTLQPLARFPLDAAIIFADLMSPVGALGLDVRFDPGPILARPVRTAADVDALRDPSPGEIAPEVAQALHLVKPSLPPGTALLGFAGAPWSLAAYLVQGRGSPGFPALRALAARDPGLLHALLEKLTTLAIRYVGKQAEAGADAVQLFDTWAGVLSHADWARLVRPHIARFLAETEAFGIPRILFVQDASHLVDGYAALPSEGLAVDWREDLAALHRRIVPGRALQGNLDPAVLLAGPEATAAAARDLLARVPPHSHIVNLGHGILPETPIESVQALVDTVHAEVLP